MNLLLKQLPNVLGIYGTGKGGIPAGDYFPPRAAQLHPEAADGFLLLQTQLNQRVRVSDMLRSAEESLQARKVKTGVQPPGFSGHNYGLSIDIAVDACLKELKLKYDELLALFAQFHWHCHRRDGRRGFEDWHFNYLGPSDTALSRAVLTKAATWAIPVESRILELYGTQMTMDTLSLQTQLKSLRMYSGDLDGDAGPLTKQAVRAFQRAWSLGETGDANPITQRTLAFVTATKKMVP